jgi:ABC-type nickel/cobalt efflux system permease component RcnA
LTDLEILFWVRQPSGLDDLSRWSMTQFATVMMISWGVLVVITGALMLYRAKLQGNEMDQVSLDDTFAREREENEALAAKVNKIQPAITVFGWLVTVATVVVVVYWVWDFIKQFK